MSSGRERRPAPLQAGDAERSGTRALARPPASPPDPGPGRSWTVLILTGVAPASLDMLAHAQALAGPRGRVMVRPVGTGALVAEALDAIADTPPTILLVDIADPEVGEEGLAELSTALGDAATVLLVLCPPGAPPRTM